MAPCTSNDTTLAPIDRRIAESSEEALAAAGQLQVALSAYRFQRSTWLSAWPTIAIPAADFVAADRDWLKAAPYRVPRRRQGSDVTATKPLEPRPPLQRHASAPIWAWHRLRMSCCRGDSAARENATAVTRPRLRHHTDTDSSAMKLGSRTAADASSLFTSMTGGVSHDVGSTKLKTHPL